MERKPETKAISNQKIAICQHLFVAEIISTVCNKFSPAKISPSEFTGINCVLSDHFIAYKEGSFGF